MRESLAVRIIGGRSTRQSSQGEPGGRRTGGTRDSETSEGQPDPPLASILIWPSCRQEKKKNIGGSRRETKKAGDEGLGNGEVRLGRLHQGC